MVKLVKALDLKSNGEILAGSNPAGGTNLLTMLTHNEIMTAAYFRYKQAEIAARKTILNPQMSSRSQVAVAHQIYQEASFLALIYRALSCTN